jgi:AcrR family transcriptional regulator
MTSLEFETGADTGARTDARVARSVRSGLEAVLRIFAEEGPEQVTHARVAELSGLHRATVYRHWPTRDDLLSDALSDASFQVQIEPTGDLHRDLVSCLMAARDILASPFGPVVTAIIDRSESSPKVQALKTGIVRSATNSIRETLLRAVDQGELPRKLDIETAVDQLAGPVTHRRLISGHDISPAYIDTVVKTFIAGQCAS